MAALKIASCLAGELLLEDALHDHVRLGGGESARASYVRRVGHAQVEHHLMVVKSLHIFQVIRKRRKENKYVFQVISMGKRGNKPNLFLLVPGGNSPLLLVLGRLTAFKRLEYFNF